MARAKKPQAPHRDRSGFYKLDTGEKLLSVTNIKKFGIPLDLTGWAGYEAGLCAMENLPKIVRSRGSAERKRMAYWLGQESNRKLKAAGALGSAVHNKIECHILEEPAPELAEEEQPFFDAFLRFMDLESPTIEATEMVLANPEDGWAGTADVFLTLPRIGRGMLLGDWKSSAGVYADFALQLAAYRRATVGWLKDGTKITPPETEAAVVIHIRPEKYPDVGYRIYPLDTSDAVYACFLNARKTALDWAKGLSETVVGEPYDPVVVGELEEEVA